MVHFCILCSCQTKHQEPSGFTRQKAANLQQTSSGSKRLGCKRSLGVLDKNIDFKAIGREDIISMFEGGE
jgi:hypothetical protein